MSDIEDIQAEERDEAVRSFLDDALVLINGDIEAHGGNSGMFRTILCDREIYGELFDALIHALPNDFGVVSRGE